MRRASSVCRSSIAVPARNSRSRSMPTISLPNPRKHGKRSRARVYLGGTVRAPRATALLLRPTLWKCVPSALATPTASCLQGSYPTVNKTGNSGACNLNAIGSCTECCPRRWPDAGTDPAGCGGGEVDRARTAVILLATVTPEYKVQRHEVRIVNSCGGCGMT